MSLMKFRPGIVYTTKSIASYIYGSDDKAALKRAERWIVEKSLNFDCLNAENICDEHNRPAKKQVIAHIIDQHKVRRNVLLFVKIESQNEGKTFLFANDSKGARRWIQLGGQKIVAEAIETALMTLLEHENKNTVVIPGGSLTTICSEISRKWRSNEKQINLNFKICILRHGLNKFDPL